MTPSPIIIPKADSRLSLSLNNAPWKEQYPYMPEVSLEIAHNGQEILLDWHVRENCTRAEAATDGGPVWEDSCVEFFFLPSPPDTILPPSDSLSLEEAAKPSAPETPPFGGAGGGSYYNIECNCAGRLLVGYGPDRHDREMASADIMAAIRRHSSLGDQPFPLTDGTKEWHLKMAIPLSTFFHHNLTTLNGLHARANFYKCGDKLRHPHFLTLFPIDLPHPDFHCPQFFGDIRFE